MMLPIFMQELLLRQRMYMELPQDVLILLCIFLPTAIQHIIPDAMLQLVMQQEQLLLFL